MAKGSGGGSAATGSGLFGFVMVVWLVIEFWYVVVAVAVLAGLWFLAPRLWSLATELRARLAQPRQLAAANAALLSERADRQHAQYLQGDPRGLYGRYLPPPMFREHGADDGPAADLRGLSS